MYRFCIKRSHINTSDLYLMPKERDWKSKFLNGVSFILWE